MRPLALLQGLRGDTLMLIPLVVISEPVTRRLRRDLPRTLFKLADLSHGLKSKRLNNMKSHALQSGGCHMQRKRLGI